jgi:hypothetical protein
MNDLLLPRSLSIERGEVSILQYFKFQKKSSPSPHPLLPLPTGRKVVERKDACPPTSVPTEGRVSRGVGVNFFLASLSKII